MVVASLASSCFTERIPASHKNDCKLPGIADFGRRWHIGASLKDIENEQKTDRSTDDCDCLLYAFDESVVFHAAHPAARHLQIVLEREKQKRLLCKNEDVCRNDINESMFGVACIKRSKLRLILNHTQRTPWAQVCPGRERG